MGLDSWASVATIIGGIAVILSGIVWVWHRFVKTIIHRVKEELDEIKDNTKELKTNGGSSMADAVKRIEARLDYLTEAMMDHLKGHE